jgi:hypothetical protein
LFKAKVYTYLVTILFLILSGFISFSFVKKGDLRFVFLSPEHAFHDYYTQKLSLYTDMHRELEAKQSETSSQLVENKRETRGESPAERLVVDPELMKTERRKKAALFLDQMRRDRVVGTVVLPCELLQRL